MYRKALAASLLLVLSPTPAAADAAQSILEKARAKQLERWEGVDAYLVNQSVAGSQVTLRFQRVEAKGPDGKPFTMFQPASHGAAGAGPVGASAGARKSGVEGRPIEERPLTPEEMELFAEGMEMTGDAQAKGIEDGLEAAGLPRGLLAATGSDPTATFDPRVMMGANAEFMRGAAQGQRELAAQSESDQRDAATQMTEFAEQARLVGMEAVDGRDAFHLRAEGLNHTQKSDDQEFTLHSVSLWIDAVEYVPLRTRMDGVASSGVESRPMTIERIDSNYRKVPGSKMYEPYRQVMRFAGVMSPAQQQEMREAQAKMTELDQQLAAMPEGQRQMIMRQMGPKMQMMKSMASGGGVEMVTEIEEIIVNPDSAAAGPARLPPVPTPAPAVAVGMPSVAAAAAAPVASPTASADALEQAQQACLKEKMEKAQAAQKKKRGFGSLLNAASRAAGLLGNQDVAKTAGDVHGASATAGDLASAARDLGLTEDEIAECQNPK